ncbi:Mfa1 family fimbria major subunit [Marseilla massiliensis]|uniref:Mfa1 family fimbria major subunit n=1 Tax=Marseilla massiliensis TaxID=1841864 RepID=UPI0020124205|nr:Mfa1 family fimbria major subunit [Marseilla massiliensis]MCL1611588.1 Mfa1 family fimbria major subunit [Marseilla massiliensis]
MKNLKNFSIALAALMLGACSNDEVVQDGGSDPVWNSDGKGYVSFSIQLPTQPNTRAWDDGSHFDDGTPSEYKVENATLILFTGADGVEKVHSAYELHPNFSPKGSATDQITTTAKITQEINKIDKTTPIKALVVLNHNDLFKVADGGDLQVSGVSYVGKTLEDLNQGLKALKTDFSWHKAGLLMSNAVMADKQGGTVAPSDAKIVGPLVTIDGDKIRPTRAEADANPAATIYVERAEAKVTVNSGNINETTVSKMPFEIVGWVLDNTSKKNYLTRQTIGFDNWKSYTSELLAGGAKDYRMVGNNAIADGLYRLYWAVDPNYANISSDLSTEYSTVGGATATIANGAMLKADGVAPGYCFENTTDLARMTEQNLTRVIVKAKFNNGNPFYIIDGNAENTSSFMNEVAVKKEVMARMFTNPEFAAWAKANVANGNTLKSDEDFVVELTEEAAGVRKVKSIALNAAGTKKMKEGAEAMPNNAVTTANKLISLSYYADGMAYYPVYIAHFGQGQTPWSESDYKDATIYGADSDARYLGRYGVVRNNWYDISVTSIKALGSPNVTEVTNEPVDKKESYISVKINVLSWAKRTQSVDL